MSTPLEDFIKKQIQHAGPMDVGQYMAIALGHPEHGYYMKQDPLGRDGDFTTAPEISQMFGEMLGIWAADAWLALRMPKKFALVECGPGRGTLMKDLMRAVKKVEGFHDAAEIHLIEISEALKEKQKANLAQYDPTWHKSFETVPTDMPLFVIGNEFLDALPFRQFVFKDGRWQERVVCVDDDALVFGMRAAGHFADKLPKRAELDDIYEISPVREVFIKNVAERLKVQHGAGIFIDYGYNEDGFGDTFQAVRGHEYVDVLSHVGDADLTSHVDFAALHRRVGKNHAQLTTQGDFLRSLGIVIRAEVLKKKATRDQSKALQRGLDRLINYSEMGELFKVLLISG
ncbi:MAG: SAM-dependent methyltransferase [Alphaproteobacteria bacterium]|nr:SAM-dependent methyltransferase [Alphaproteobacteria bacterium]